MQQMDAFLSVVTSIPGIDNHDANAVRYLHSYQLLSLVYFFFLVSYSLKFMLGISWFQQRWNSLVLLLSFQLDTIFFAEHLRMLLCLLVTNIVTHDNYAYFLPYFSLLIWLLLTETEINNFLWPLPVTLWPQLLSFLFVHKSTVCFA